MPIEHIDIDSYWRRVGLTGVQAGIQTRAANLSTLQAIVASHTATIAFENLDPFMDKPVRLDIPSLQQKLIEQLRGGYCFEHNLLLRDVLLQLGYNVTSLLGRVLWNTQASITQRSHMLLRIDLDESIYLVDVGFGGVTPTGTLRLKSDIEQSTPHGAYRIVSIDAEFLMQARIGDEWRSMYRFDLQEQHPIDYEATNWYLSTHPQSHFRHNLLASMALPDRRQVLNNNHLSTYYLDGRREERLLNNVASIRNVLTQTMRINLDTELMYLLDTRLATIAALAE